MNDDLAAQMTPEQRELTAWRKWVTFMGRGLAGYSGLYRDRDRHFWKLNALDNVENRHGRFGAGRNVTGRSS